MRLQHQIAAVTGGASGIGAAIVERLAAEGAQVISLDLNDPEQPIAASRKTARRRIDVTDEQSVATAFAEIERAYGRLDVLVNSAGIGRDVPFLETSAEVFDRVIAVNLRGTFLAGRAAARIMVRQDSGRIINIGSVSGTRGNVGRAAYGASKAGVTALTEVMAVELAAHGVLVNAIAPGPVDTPLVQEMHTPAARSAWTRRVPLGRYGTPQEIAAAAVFLASADAGFITGLVLRVDGGFLCGGILPADVGGERSDPS